MIKHFILTRNLYPEDYPYKSERLELIRGITIPSLRRQTNQNFVWVLNAAEGLDAEEFGDLNYIVDPSMVTRIQRMTQLGDKVITTRLDNDDALLPNFVADLHKIAETCEVDTVVDFKGYRIDSRHKIVYADTRYGDIPSPFISVVEQRLPKRLRGALSRAHTEMGRHYPVLNPQIKGWVQVIHYLNQVMSRPAEVVDALGEALAVDYAEFVESVGITLPDEQPRPPPTSELIRLARKLDPLRFRTGIAQSYQQWLDPIQNDELTLVEIGIGERAPASGVRPLLLWRRYFRHARIVRIDISDSPPQSMPGTETYSCDATDKNALQKLLKDHDIAPDIVIDDGAHTPESHQISLGALFGSMRPGGLYFIEKLQVCLNPKSFKQKGVNAKNNTITYLEKLQSTGESDSVFLDADTNKALAAQVASVEFMLDRRLALITRADS